MPDLEDGESIEMKGSAAKPYLIRNVGGVYSCTCPAWLNQSKPHERRTCKHIRKLRGDAAETERLGAPLPEKKPSGAKKDGPPILLAESWDNSADLTDWWMSEKLDGVRAYWDGQRFLSRQGNEFLAPEWFVRALPPTPLDGELWIDRQKFQRTVSVVRRQDRGHAWKEIKYVVFDAPAQPGPFEDRVGYLHDQLGALVAETNIRLHEQIRCQGAEHLRNELARIEAAGGEGLMLREPASTYAVGRSSTLLKVKQFHDAEATVMEHSPGKGKHKGRLGALVVQLPDGKVFSVGTGFSDAERRSPPAIGSVITFRYQELSDGGVPRFPSYLRVAADGDPPAAAAKTSAKKTKAPAAKNKTAKAAAPAAPSTTSPPGTRYFVYSDDKSHKFWEVSVDGTDVTVRYGKVGATGQTKVKSFDSDAEASAFVDKQIVSKTGKGYEETES